MVGQSPKLCLGFVLDSVLSSAFTFSDLPSEAGFKRWVLGKARRWWMLGDRTGAERLGHGLHKAGVDPPPILKL